MLICPLKIHNFAHKLVLYDNNLLNCGYKLSISQIIFIISINYVRSRALYFWTIGHCFLVGILLALKLLNLKS